MTSREKDTKPLAAAMGAQLRERRLCLDLSLSEVARRSSVSPSYLVALENGTSTPSLPVLARIAHALDVTIGGLLASDVSSAVELSHLGQAPGTTVASSEALQLQVAFIHASNGDTGSCPFSPGGSTVVVVVRSGSLDVDVDGERWELHDGDSLHALKPTSISWSSPRGPSTSVWAVAPLEGA